MRRFFCLPAAALLALSACTHNVDPRIAPARIAAVEPPIHARALLLIVPSFETYASRSSSGVHKFNYRLGQSAARALTDMIAQSFDSAEVRRVGNAETLQWLAGPSDTTIADLLLIPHIETGGYSTGTFKVAGDVRLRLDVRSFRTPLTHSWTGVGHSDGMFRSASGVTGNAIEQAISALADSLRTHRARIEVGR